MKKNTLVAAIVVGTGVTKRRLFVWKEAKNFARLARNGALKRDSNVDHFKPLQDVKTVIWNERFKFNQKAIV